jgi:hypothetical protein
LGMVISISSRRILAVGLDRDCLNSSENERLYLDLLRPHLIQSYRNLQILDLMKRAVEGNEKELIVVNRTGQVQLMNDDVWRIFAKYFGMPRFHRSLADVLHHWIEYERSHIGRINQLSLLLTCNEALITLYYKFCPFPSSHGY